MLLNELPWLRWFCLFRLCRRQVWSPPPCEVQHNLYLSISIPNNKENKVSCSSVLFFTVLPFHQTSNYPPIPLVSGNNGWKKEKKKLWHHRLFFIPQSTNCKSLSLAPPPYHSQPPPLAESADGKDCLVRVILESSSGLCSANARISVVLTCSTTRSMPLLATWSSLTMDPAPRPGPLRAPLAAGFRPSLSFSRIKQRRPL
jgi:hypothetical protein